MKICVPVCGNAIPLRPDSLVHIMLDPAFFQDPSGCTAVAALLTHDRRLFVVRDRHAGIHSIPI